MQQSHEQVPVLAEPKTRPSTAADDGSVYSCNISQGSKLGDDLLSTPGRSLGTGNKTARSGKQNFKTLKEKVVSARKSARSSQKADLGPINISPSEYSVPVNYSENIFQSGDIKDLPEKDSTKENPAAIEVLKRVLKNQKKGKLTRSSTSLSNQRPNLDEDARKLASSSFSMNVVDRARTSRGSVTKRNPLTSTKNLPTQAQKLSMKRFLSQSTVSDDFFSNDYRNPK